MRHSDAVQATQRMYLMARLRLSIWEQDQFWVPACAWDTFMRSSIIQVTLPASPEQGSEIAVAHPQVTDLVVRPDFQIPDIVHIASLSAEYRRAVLSFIHTQSELVCAGMAVEPAFVATMGRCLPDDIAQALYAQSVAWAARTRLPTVRDTWLATLPLVRALHA